MIVEIVPATLAHAEVIAANARQADIDEMWAAARHSPLDAMRGGLRLTRRARTGLIDGEPVCMFGVTPMSLIRGWGAPWMVASARMDELRAQKELLRRARGVFAEWKREYALLMNFVDERNLAAQRWIAWLGFDLKDTYTIGADAMPFRMFIWRRDNV